MQVQIQSVVEFRPCRSNNLSGDIMPVKGPHFEQRCPRQGRTLPHLHTPVMTGALCCPQLSLKYVRWARGQQRLDDSVLPGLFAYPDGMKHQCVLTYQKPCPRKLVIQADLCPGPTLPPSADMFHQLVILELSHSLPIWNLNQDTSLHGCSFSRMFYLCHGTIVHL